MGPSAVFVRLRGNTGGSSLAVMTAFVGKASSEAEAEADVGFVFGEACGVGEDSSLCTDCVLSPEETVDASTSRAADSDSSFTSASSARIPLSSLRLRLGNAGAESEYCILEVVDATVPRLPKSEAASCRVSLTEAADASASGGLVDPEVDDCAESA